jgi:hypothetical protein
MKTNALLMTVLLLATSCSHPRMASNTMNDYKLSKNLKRLVYALAQPGGRMVGTDGHDEARALLDAELEALGCEPYRGDGYELPYHEDGLDFCNLVGVIPGRDRSKKPVLIGAHYDSVIPHPCADDNASAVAVALEVGRMLMLEPPERDTVIALFDAEEPPYYLTEAMGSNRFYEDDMATQGVHAAVIMDMVGHDLQIPVSLIPVARRLPGLEKAGLPIPHLRQLLFMTGAESHPELEDMLRACDRPWRLPTIFVPNAAIGDMSDHGVFRRNGVPYLFLSCGRWQHYHEPSDTPDRLNYAKMARIARYTESLVRSLGDRVLEPSDEPISDTSQLEIASLKQSLGPFLPILLKRFRIERLEGRDDLDAFANALLGLGL